MSKETPHDFIARHLFTKNNIVTYRSLSRDLWIHVNQAKNELAAFYETMQGNTKRPFATYMVCGEISSTHSNMDIDSEVMSGKKGKSSVDEDSEAVVEWGMVMVGEKNLEVVKSQFSRITSVYVHSLSPSPLRDAGLLNEVNDRVREIDIGKGAALAQIVGRLVSQEVKAPPAFQTKTIRKDVQPTPATASTSKQAPSEPSTSATTSEKVQPPPPQVKAPAKGKGKEKVTNKMAHDFFAKRPSKTKEVTKDEKPTETDKDKEKSKPKVAVNPPLKPQTELPRARSVSQPLKVTEDSEMKASTSANPEADTKKRGIKRKSTTGIESERHKSSSRAGSSRQHIKKSVLLSSDEEDDEEENHPVARSRPRKRPTSPIDSDDDDLRAMMDVDEADVDHISRPDTASNMSAVPDTQSEREDIDLDKPEDGDNDDDEDDLAPVKRTKKPRKVIPKGRNGLPKRAVQKKRTFKDEKGYTHNETYTSYESASESDAPPPAKKVSDKKSEKSGSKSVEVRGGVPQKTSTKKATTGGAAKKTGKQRDLSMFFGAKPK